jgi:hypothetical protein
MIDWSRFPHPIHTTLSGRGMTLSVPGVRGAATGEMENTTLVDFWT